MTPIPKITVRSNELRFEFHLNQSPLTAEKSLELIEDLSNGLLWAFKIDGRVVTIYHPPDKPFEVNIEGSEIVIDRSIGMLNWLPPSVVSRIMQHSADIEVHFEEENKRTSLMQFITDTIRV
jgi:hypothetical protein